MPENEKELDPIIIELISDVEYMCGLYKNGKHGAAEKERDKIADRLDIIMRLGLK